MKIKEDRTGRSSFWPEYMQCDYPDRQLAIIVGNSLYCETGEHLTAKSFAELVDVLFQNDLLCFTDSLIDDNIFPFLHDCIKDEKTVVTCSKDGWPTSVRIKRKSSTRWIIPSNTWERKIDADFLSDMRQMFTFMGLVKGTPSSLGVSLMRQSWANYHFTRQSSPGYLCQTYLFKHRVGGRCDTTCEKGTFYPSLLELDGSSFYLAHWLKLPIGTAKKFHGDTYCWNTFATFFCECTVTIHQELALGPFPLKQERKNKIVYPTLPGEYTAYLWKEQIEDCIQVGCTVSVINGYGWDSFTSDTEQISRLLYKKRINALSEWQEYCAKKIAVSMIGRFGSHGEYYTLIPEGEEKEGEPCVISDDFHASGYYVRKHVDYNAPNMIHWFSYCLMQASRTLWKMAYPYAEEGRLVATNYDAILVLEQDETHKYVQKKSLESKMCEMGDWRWSRLTNVTILGDRSLKCDQRTTTPGVTR